MRSAGAWTPTTSAGCSPSGPLASSDETFASRRTGAGCHNQIMETPLSPLEFARRTRRLHGDREAVVDGDLRLTYTAVLRPLRPVVLGAAGSGGGARRPRGHDLAEHARAAGVLLLRAAARRRPRADQLPADPGGLRLHREPLRRHGGLRRRGIPGGGGRHPRPDARGEALRGPGGQAGTAGSTTRRRSRPPIPATPGRRSASGTCSRSTTPAAPRRARRAS